MGNGSVATPACQVAKQHIGLFCKAVSHLGPNWSKQLSALPNPERVGQTMASNFLTSGC